MNKNAKLAAALSGVLVLGMGLGYMLSPTAQSSERVRDLCASYPTYCEPCGAPGMPPCPQGDGGWLCCSETSGICVLANGSCGSGHIFGYCSNYTTNSDGTVTCHDEP